MNCIILGDRFNKGMKSRGCAALIKKDKSATIIDNQYKIIKDKFNPKNIIYVYGFDSKRFLNYISKNDYLNIITIFNENYETKNSGYSLSLAQGFLGESTIIIDGYNFISKSIFKNWDDNLSKILVSEKSTSSLGCISNNGFVENISYDLDNKLCDIFYFTKDASKHLKQRLSTNKYSNAFLFEILNDMIDDGIKLMCHRI